MTFEASVAYITLAEPKTFILEMVWKKAVRVAFIECLRSTCGDYALWSGIIDSAGAIPSSRSRFYVIGVNVKKVSVCTGHGSKWMLGC